MGLPRFTAGRIVLDPGALRYNPQNDVIFPSVLRIGDYIERALGRYYLYYAPHGAGGICLAVADDPLGPWQEYSRNPIIESSWPPHHDAEHVSSPHAIWRPDREEVWLYYHGDNETTRWATSKDGVRFQYGGEAIQADQYDMDGASYARVFESPFAEGPARFLMTLLMYRYEEGSWDSFEHFGLYGAWSSDGASWQLVDHPTLDNRSVKGVAFICSPFVTTVGTRVFLLYHADESGEPTTVSNVYAVEIDANLVPVGPPVLLCKRGVFGVGNERVSDPYLLLDGAHVYLFGAVGPRLRQRIGVTMGT